MPMQCLQSHSHTNRTLDSLNNVDRPLPQVGGVLPNSVAPGIGLA